jgi:hypothetical protein
MLPIYENMATNIKQFLYTNSFEYVWNDLRVDDKELFLKLFVDQ